MSSRNDENVPLYLSLACEDVPMEWYENRLLSSFMAFTATLIVRFAEMTDLIDYNLTLRGIIALAYIGGRFLDWQSTDRTIDIIEKANAFLPDKYQLRETAITVPDHPRHEDLFRWQAAVGEGIVLGLTTIEPSIAIGMTVNSFLAALNNYRTAARSARIVEYAQAEELPNV